MYVSFCHLLSICSQQHIDCCWVIRRFAVSLHESKLPCHLKTLSFLPLTGCVMGLAWLLNLFIVKYFHWWADADKHVNGIVILAWMAVNSKQNLGSAVHCYTAWFGSNCSCSCSWACSGPPASSTGVGFWFPIPSRSHYIICFLLPVEMCFCSHSLLWELFPLVRSLYCWLQNGLLHVLCVSLQIVSSCW